ncbi:MAG TPA: type VI secretion system protein TssA [Paraburkholderia sp.]|jgi:type VI secretion system protein ImpA
MKTAYPNELSSGIAAAFDIDIDIDFDALLAPLPGEGGAGVPLRYEPVYQQIRDARHQDDASLPMREWERPLIKADLNAVAALCADALQTRSKDFQIAAWLCDAWTRLYGIQGFDAGVQLVTNLVERYWETAWPQIEDDDQAARIAPFVWLNETLALVLTLDVPLMSIDGHEPPALCLDDWQRAGNAGKDNKSGGHAKAEALSRALIAKHVRGDNLAMLVDLRIRLDGAQQAWNLLAQRLDDFLVGDDAPGMSQVKDVLLRMSHAATSLLGEHWPPKAGPLSDLEDDAALRAELPGGDIPALEAVDVEPAYARALGGTIAIADRAHAYRLLETVADYLARQEPHSPTPYLLRRAVSWGRMPLAELMREILREEGDLSRYVSMLDEQ